MEQYSPTWLELSPYDPSIASAKFLVATHDYGKMDKPGVGFVTSYRIEHGNGGLTKVHTLQWDKLHTSSTS